MNPQNSTDYIAALKKNGAGDEAVLAILRGAGWSEKETASALASYYEGLTGLAVPARPRLIGGPREAFLHLLSFLTLSVWSIAAGSLWLTLIGIWFPDPIDRYYGDPLAEMAFQLACVLVAFPLYIFVMRNVWRGLIEQPAQADSAIRRWLTYMALLIAAGTVIGDLVVFIERLLSGSITAPFAARVLVVLILAGGVFWFYLKSVQISGEDRAVRLRRYGAVGTAAATAVVALTLVCAFAWFGSPSERRLSASDRRRSEDLEAIASVLQNRWKAAEGAQTRTLPKTIAELPESTTLRLTDPVSGAPYRYTPLEGMRYQLCASFQTDTTNLPVHARRSLFRVHPSGEHCFALDAPVGAK